MCTVLRQCIPTRPNTIPTTSHCRPNCVPENWDGTGFPSQFSGTRLGRTWDVAGKPRPAWAGRFLGRPWDKTPGVRQLPPGLPAQSWWFSCPCTQAAGTGSRPCDTGAPRPPLISAFVTRSSEFGTTMNLATDRMPVSVCHESADWHSCHCSASACALPVLSPRLGGANWPPSTRSRVAPCSLHPKRIAT